MGVAAGGGVLYAVTKASGIKEKRTLSSVIVEAAAIFGGVMLGYHLSNALANRLFTEAVDALPQTQATSLPSGDTPVETPSAPAAMGAVEKSAKAVSATVTPEEVAGGKVIDITKALG